MQRAREQMVASQLAARDIDDPRVLSAMGRVPRERFVAPDQIEYAYDDRPLPLGAGATISQPYIVALMSQLADIQPGVRVLDVGTGSGYQAAVAAELGGVVFGVEIDAGLAEQARTRLQALGYAIPIRTGDGHQGWPERGPFDVILVAAAAATIPPALVDQLALGGRMVIPIGQFRRTQILTVVTRTENGVSTRKVTAVAFVPLVPSRVP